jgi:hypothetical protein
LYCVSLGAQSHIYATAEIVSPVVRHAKRECRAHARHL